MNKQIIIIGGGTSIREGIDKGLWNKIKDKFTVGLNYSYHYFPNPTFQSFVDYDFYNKQIKDLESLSLVIGNKKKFKEILDNTIMIPAISKYYRDIKPGVYKASLVGLWALSLTIYLTNPGDEIYLLGYDYGEAKRGNDKTPSLTHFYQGKINHRGIGKINYYNAEGRARRDFGVYEIIKDIKIYNVSQISRIPTDIFPKITYDEFLKRLNRDKYNQEELRNEIKNKLKWAKTA